MRVFANELVLLDCLMSALGKRLISWRLLFDGAVEDAGLVVVIVSPLFAGFVDGGGVDAVWSCNDGGCAHSLNECAYPTAQPRMLRALCDGFQAALTGYGNVVPWSGA